MTPHSSPMTPTQGRILVLAASVLWSFSGAFTKVLTIDTWFGFHEPAIESLELAGRSVPVQIACYRVLFAGMFLTTMLRPGDFKFRPLMLLMAGCFALMNLSYITAQALGSAANAILLQCTAPLWMYIVSVMWMGEATDRRGLITLLIGLCGIGVIIVGGWNGEELPVILVALFSGMMFAAVVLCLRSMRGLSPAWLTVWNHLLAALALVPLVVMLRPPTWGQFGVLFLFGAFQLGLPYFLMAKALRVVSPAEAGTLSLIEPILTPIWAYWASREIPSGPTFLGGAIILAALVWRYWPFRAGVVEERIVRSEE